MSAQGPITGRHCCVRQLWNVKGQGDPMLMEVNHLALRRPMPGWALARAHARTGDSVKIAGYLGRGDAFERAMVRFGDAYAVTNEADHAALVEAIRDGRITAVVEVSNVPSTAMRRASPHDGARSRPAAPI